MSLVKLMGMAVAIELDVVILRRDRSFCKSSASEKSFFSMISQLQGRVSLELFSRSAWPEVQDDIGWVSVKQKKKVFLYKRVRRGAFMWDGSCLFLGLYQKVRSSK